MTEGEVELSWMRFQREATERLRQQFDADWSQRLEFWKHLTMVEATVLGLTVGLLTGVSGRPSGCLIASWIALLVGLAVGCTLIRVAMTQHANEALRQFRTQYDVSDIQAKVAAGKLITPSAEHAGLMLAALYRGSPDNVRQAMVEAWARDQAGGEEAALSAIKRYEPQLAGHWIGLPRRSPVSRWLSEHVGAMEQVFYLVAGVACVLLLLSFVTGSEAPKQIARPHGVAVSGVLERRESTADKGPRSLTSGSSADTHGVKARQGP